MFGWKDCNYGTTGVSAKGYLHLGISKQCARLPHSLYQRDALGGVNIQTHVGAHINVL